MSRTDLVRRGGLNTRADSDRIVEPRHQHRWVDGGVDASDRDGADPVGLHLRADRRRAGPGATRPADRRSVRKADRGCFANAVLFVTVPCALKPGGVADWTLAKLWKPNAVLAFPLARR